jgi:hypothetical protein
MKPQPPDAPEEPRDLLGEESAQSSDVVYDVPQTRPPGFRAEIDQISAVRGLIEMLVDVGQPVPQWMLEVDAEARGNPSNTQVYAPVMKALTLGDWRGAIARERETIAKARDEAQKYLDAAFDYAAKVGSDAVHEAERIRRAARTEAATMGAEYGNRQLEDPSELSTGALAGTNPLDPEGAGLGRAESNATDVVPPLADHSTEPKSPTVAHQEPHPDRLRTLSETLASLAAKRTGSDAAAVLVPTGPHWEVSGGVRLRPDERTLLLDPSHWLISEIAVGGRALLIEDTDIVRPRLAGAPLASWRHLLAVPFPGVRAALVLARGDETARFKEADLAAVVPIVAEAMELMVDAVREREAAAGPSSVRVTSEHSSDEAEVIQMVEYLRIKRPARRDLDAAESLRAAVAPDDQ